MIQSRHIENGAAVLFAGALLLVIWQPEWQRLFWPLVVLSAVGTGYGLWALAPADRVRRAKAWWVVPLTFAVLAGIYAWLAPGLSQGRSLQLAGVLLLFGVALIWVRRRAA